MVALKGLGCSKVVKDTFHSNTGPSLRGQHPQDDHGNRFKLMPCYSTIPSSIVEKSSGGKQVNIRKYRK